jgi:hypothetical protein
VVLLSPAGAAREDFTTHATPDHFSSADERGDRFLGLVRELMEEKA